MSEGQVAAIGALNLDYAIAIDEDQLERWPDFFADECLYRIVGRRDYELGRPGSLVVCDSKGMLADRVSAIRRVNVFEPHRYRHILGPTKVLKEEGGRFETYTSYLVVRTTQHGAMVVFSAGSYRDQVVFQGGAPKLRARNVVLDSETIDTLLSIPI
jgi:anthranilate 1,2-dioxygenase small subunit